MLPTGGAAQALRWKEQVLLTLMERLGSHEADAEEAEEESVFSHISSHVTYIAASFRARLGLGLEVRVKR